MAWDFDNSRPIYIQIADYIKRQIVSGQYAPGDKLESVRELATTARVNPNTMQKALSFLEQDGLIHANRTAGRFITEDMQTIQTLKIQYAKEEIALFLLRMESLGYEKSEILKLIETHNP